MISCTNFRNGGTHNAIYQSKGQLSFISGKGIRTESRYEKSNSYNNHLPFPISNPFPTKIARQMMPAYGCLVRINTAAHAMDSTIPVTSR